MDETEADKWLQYFDDMRSPGEVLGLAGSGATGAMAGNGSTAITNGAFGGMLDNIIGNGKNSTTYPSRKGNGNGSKIILGDGGPEGVYLNADGTYGGIATISAGEERIPEAAMRALREDSALKGMDKDSISAIDMLGTREGLDNITTHYLVWTEKGRRFIYDLLLNDKLI